MIVILSYVIVRRCRTSTATSHIVRWRHFDSRLVVNVTDESAFESQLTLSTMPDGAVQTEGIATPAILPIVQPTTLLKPGPVYPRASIIIALLLLLYT